MRVEARLVAVVEPALELDHGLVARADLGLPREEQLLDVLQRVRLDPGAHALPHDLEQVDEHLAAEQLVDLLLARRVRAHQPRQRRRLVGGVVVDVHVRERAPALGDEVDELLERGLLAVADRTPRTARYVVRSVRLPPQHPEEKLEPRGRVEERVALHVEEQVARRRRRQQPEPAPIQRRRAGGR